MPQARADAAVIAALTAIVAEHGRWGFWKCFDRLRLQGQPWNHKRVHQYCALRLNLPLRTKRRVPQRLRHHVSAEANIAERVSRRMVYLTGELTPRAA